jgi:hypothetical protein
MGFFCLAVHNATRTLRCPLQHGGGYIANY